MKLICFDMDGVIFEHANFWIELHKVWGTYEEGLALTKKHVTTNYQKLVEEVVGRLWKGKSQQLFDELIQKQQYKPDVKETILALKEKGYRTVIISSGPKQLAERAQQEVGIDDVFANEVIFEMGLAAGRIEREFWRIRSDNKAVILRELSQKYNIDLKDMIVVGHEENDIQMMRVAGFSIALNPESEAVRKAANKVVEGSIKNILPLIDEFEQLRGFSQSA